MKKNLLKKETNRGERINFDATDICQQLTPTTFEYCDSCKKKIMINQKLKSQLLKAGYRGGFELSELIDACGDITLSGYGNNWNAYDNTFPDSGYNNKGEGKTPSEAVANLWLKLNEPN